MFTRDYYSIVASAFRVSRVPTLVDWRYLSEYIIYVASYSLEAFVWDY